MAEKITSRSENYSEWYVELVTRAQLADYSPVKGCMVMRPRGYAMWELLQKDLDARFKATGHSNAYFPMLIPESFIAKESEHVEGFSPELAVVTYAGGEKLEHPLVLRPTSETIIWSMYKKWIQSYRDLPILINQWANVIRWEKRTRLFLRTTEFLWQEGHTAHETEQEAREETITILNVYKNFAEEVLALPVIHGTKSEKEKFAGAVETYGVEALMQDGRALQAGTSHFLGQKFAKAFDVQFQNKDLSLEYVWATSWGVSTRLIGAVIMMHSDDKGLVIPPKIAPTEAVIIPIYKNANKQAVMDAATTLKSTLQKEFRIEMDADDNQKPGWKYAEWELRGVPVRIELGPRDLENHQLVFSRRDTSEKIIVPFDEASATLTNVLQDIQSNLLAKARSFTQQHTHTVHTFNDFEAQINQDIPGYILAPWDGTTETELAIQEKTKATTRVILKDPLSTDARCIVSGKQAKYIAVFAKAY